MSDSGSEPNQRPRFVAGAVCPSCKAMDRMVIDGAADERRCVACGFVEARPDAKDARVISLALEEAREQADQVLH